MLIACESCGAHYSAADADIRDKFFRARCQQCDGEIVLWSWARAKLQAARGVSAGAGVQSAGAGAAASVFPLALATARPPLTTPYGLRRYERPSAPPAFDEPSPAGVHGSLPLIPGVPVLAPLRSEESRILLALVATAVMLLLCVIALVATMLGRARPTLIVAPAASTRVVQDVRHAARPQATEVETQATVPASREQTEEPYEESPADSLRSAREAHRAATGSTSEISLRTPAVPAAATEAPRAARPAPTVTTAPPRRDRLDELIAQAVPHAASSRAPVAAPTPAGPASPARADVIAAINRITSAVRACGQGTAGIAQVRIVFAPTGQATSALVTAGPFVGTPAGSCIAREARQAHVPPFARGRPFVVSYPFALR